MTQPVRIGLVGYGFGGRYFHAPLLASAVNCDFLGVVTTSPERRKQVEGELPGRRAYASLAELVADGAEAVAISTPADTHIALVTGALQLGLATVCDKPFALDAESAQGAVELSDKLGIPLTVYQNRRWDSDFLTIRKLIDDGTLGRVTRFESRFERFEPEPGPPEAGGGTLLDFGSHLVDQALHLFGAPESVYAEMNVRPDNGRDDDVFLALRHRDGVVSHLWGSWRQPAPGPRFRVSGIQAGYVVGGMDGQEASLLAGARPSTTADWGAEKQEAWGVLHRGDEQRQIPSERGAWDTFYPAFAEAVRGRGPLPVDARDAVATATVLDAARTSAATGRSITL
jgi:predicted dehydrogenase